MFVSRYVSVFVFVIGICYGAIVEKVKDDCVTDLRDIVAQSDFNITEFAGAWYTHSTTDYVYGEHTWDSMTNVIYAQEDGSITTVTSGHQRYNDICRPAIIYMSEDDTGEYSGSFMEHTMKLKVLYTDYKTAVMFYCFQMNDDGTCQHNKEQIELWSRVLDDLTNDEINDLKLHVQKIECTDAEDLVVMVQGNCKTLTSAEPDTVEGSCQKSPIDWHLRVDRNKITGQWQSVIVAVSEGEEPVAASYRFTQSQNEDILYVTTSIQRTGELCSPVDIQKYQRLSHHHYVQLGVSVPIEFWYRNLGKHYGLFMCFEREGGRCSKSHAKILTQDSLPVSYDLLQQFNNNLLQKLCQKYDVYVDQHADLCKIPDLVEYLTIYSDTVHYIPDSVPVNPITAMQIGSCRLGDIPVQDPFQASQLAGLWYELARPRNIMNQYESAVVYFEEHADHTLHSTYSGVINGKCTPPVSSHAKPAENSTRGADMMAKLLGPDEIFPLMHYRVAYYDGMYSIHYGCFGTDDDGVCIHAEASIYGRQPTVDQDMLDKLYALFPDMCLSSDHLRKTIHHVDCSDWVVPHVDSKTSQEHCNVKDIPVQSAVDMDEMKGSWYIIASKDIVANRLDIKREGEIFTGEAVAKIDGECVTKAKISFTQVGEVNNGDLLVNILTESKGGYHSLKIIYTDYQVALWYECNDEDIYGKCKESGTRVILLSRTQSLDTLRRSLLESHLKLPCGDLSDLETKTEFCEKPKDCRIKNIPAMDNIDIHRLSGLWFDVMSSHTFKSKDAGTFKFSVDENGLVHVKYTALQSNGSCLEPLSAALRKRGEHGDFLTLEEVSGQRMSGFRPFKIIYTDYDNIMIPYACAELNLNGECGEGGKRLRIISRTKSITPEVKAYLMKYLDVACVHHSSIGDSSHEADCSHKLV